MRKRLIYLENSQHIPVGLSWMNSLFLFVLRRMGAVFVRSLLSSYEFIDFLVDCTESSSFRFWMHFSAPRAKLRSFYKFLHFSMHSVPKYFIGTVKLFMDSKSFINVFTSSRTLAITSMWDCSGEPGMFKWKTDGIRHWSVLPDYCRDNSRTAMLLIWTSRKSPLREIILFCCFFLPASISTCLSSKLTSPLET